jgi:hypothetical protein
MLRGPTWVFQWSLKLNMIKTSTYYQPSPVFLTKTKQKTSTNDKKPVFPVKSDSPNHQE